MPTRYIKRQTSLGPGENQRATANTIYVDSDTNTVKVGTGASGTSENELVDLATAQTISGAKTFTGNVVLTDVSFEIGDDDLLTLGDDNDQVLVNKSASNLANTAITSVLIGTPVTQALAANSLIVSNVTASGDVMIAANRGGASEEYLMADSSAGTLFLTGPGGVINFESGTTQVLGINSATVIEVADDVQLTLGNDNDQVALNRSSSHAANTVLTGALVGTPVTQALAANSLLVSNITASGDIMIAANRGGNSEEYFMADSSAGVLTLTAPTTTSFEIGTAEKAVIDSTGFRNVTSAEVVTSTNVITAAESGRTFFLNSGTEFASTLPAPALGLNFTFIVSAAPSGADYTVVTEGGCQILGGHILTSDVYTDSAVDADFEAPAAGTTISFVSNVSVAGDRAYLISDGTSWYAQCSCAAVAGITITG